MTDEGLIVPSGPSMPCTPHRKSGAIAIASAIRGQHSIRGMQFTKLRTVQRSASSASCGQ